MKRYYAPSIDRGILDAEQSHHCAQVMRQEVGELFTAFDGPRRWKPRRALRQISNDEVKFQILAKAAFAARRSIRSGWPRR